MNVLTTNPKLLMLTVFNINFSNYFSYPQLTFPGGENRAIQRKTAACGRLDELLPHLIKRLTPTMR